MNKLTSQTITALRFPLIVAVVLLHTYIVDRPVGGKVYLATGSYPVFDWFSFIYRSELANMAVPLFFMISGYLFFYGMQRFKIAVFKTKLKKRIHTLLIPFLFWNTFFLLFTAAIYILAPSLLTYKKSITQMSLPEILNCYWDMSQGLIPLWFIRDLMIINLFSPVIYLLLHNKVGKIILLAFTALFLSQIFHYTPGIGMRCAYPYMLGAWFSINGKDFVLVLRKYRLCLSVATLMALGYDTYLWSQGEYCFAVNRFAQICGILTIPLWVAWFIERRGTSIGSTLAQSSFFVFVFHMFIIHIPVKLWVYVLPVNAWTAITALIFIPIMVSFVCVGIYFVMKKTTPRLTSIIVGER